MILESNFYWEKNFFIYSNKKIFIPQRLISFEKKCFQMIFKLVIEVVTEIESEFNKKEKKSEANNLCLEILKVFLFHYFYY
jgi:hypothetical protein